MMDAESFSCLLGSTSNGSGESSVATSQDGKNLYHPPNIYSIMLVLSCLVELGVTPNADRDTHLTGVYDLVAVLTHKGRSADSGHYVAWVKQENGKWIEYDDDNPIPQREEDITKLSGRGDWHMACICMYKARGVST
ncbi:hypothetical protein ACOSP7_020225 [Xanthoceras sorbifolium]